MRNPKELLLGLAVLGMEGGIISEPSRDFRAKYKSLDKAKKKRNKMAKASRRANR